MTAPATIDTRTAWIALHTANNAGRQAERADVLALLRGHQAVLKKRGDVDLMEHRRIDELIHSIADGLHDGLAGEGKIDV